MTGASLKDATRQLFGAKTAESTWAPVDIPEFSKTQGAVDQPTPRRGFATACNTDVDIMTIVLWGGIDDHDEILSDGWLLSLDP